MGVRDPAIRARGVRYRYPGEAREALAGLDVEIESGEIFAFLGPNGSGKSTLFRLLATLAAPQEGEVDILGIPWREDRRRIRERLGVVFQTPGLDGSLTVTENLRLHGRLYGLTGQEIRVRSRALVERFGLSDRRGDRVETLSGGLSRRVEVAKSLLPRPPLLLLDEPSTGLDPAARRRLWELLEAIRADEGTTVLLTTHFMEEGERADRLALLSRGRVVARGEPESLVAALGEEVVTARTEDPARLRERLEEAGLGSGEIREEPGVIHFLDSRRELSLSELLEKIRPLSKSLTVSRPTLEDLFLWRTGERLED